MAICIPLTYAARENSVTLLLLDNVFCVVVVFRFVLCFFFFSCNHIVLVKSILKGENKF